MAGSEYVPTTEEVRHGYAVSLEEFDRWLAYHEAQVLEDAADAYTNSEGGSKARPHARRWLRERAEVIRRRAR